ncbi:hypothetical protein [Maribellus mangrovi]|uniref:hypothetical protein n=1 Tax=Maribellus mangrovi TaxID=3133146 RepID=UPI0030EDBBBB
MKIYDKNSVELLDVQVSDESYRFREIAGVSALTLYFRLNEFVEIPVQSYVDYQGERFYLFDTSNFKKNSSEDFNYTLILHGIAEKLNTLRFYDFVQGGLIFTLTATPADHIAMLVNVLNSKDSGWSVGTVDDMSEIVVNYNHNSCMEALGMMCDEAETEFEITGGKVINLRKTEYNKETPLELAYGKGNGLKPGVERRNDDNKRPVERLFVQGGTRNIDYSKYGSRYLLLPANQQLTYNGRTYQVDENGLYIQRNDKALITNFEGSLDASTIYPSRIGVVSDVEIEDLENNLYNVIDDSIPESLNFEEQLIAGQTMTIVFQTGMLTGKEFEVHYTHEFKRFELVPKDIDGYNMPSGAFVPAVNDTFVVFGCSFPDAYVRDDATKTGASWDMFREAVAYMYEAEEDKYSYGGSVSPIWLKEGWGAISLKLILGGYCSLTDPELGGVLIRIRSIKDYVNNPYDVEIDLSNALVKPSIASTLAKINSYKSSLQQLIQNYYETIEEGGDIGDIIDILRESGYIDTQTKLISGQVIWKEGMTYETTDFLYLILGTRYECPATTITLQDSDPTNGRIDVFYLDTFGNLNVKTGTPSANPLEPVLGELELFVQSVFIGAGALEPSNISVEKIYDEKTAQEWTPTATAEAGKTYINLESIEDPYSGDKHIKAEVDVPDEEVSLPDHYIGEEYQGGKIFWINPADSRKGLIAAEFDTVTDVFWSRLSGFPIYSTNGRATAIGTGQANFAAMLANDAAAGQAARWVDELVIDGYDDWFIGSEDEMKMLWKRRNQIGNFNPTKDYWTSTEKDWNEARRIDWESGTAASRDKNTRRNVRAIRAFDDSLLPSSTPVEYYTPVDTNIVFQAPEEVLAAEGILSFKMKSSLPWRPNSILRIETYLGAVRTGSCGLSPATNLFGFNPLDNESYQLVAIYHANFALSQTRFDAVKFSFIGSWPNDIDVLIDSIRYQHTTALQEREQGVVLQVQEQVLIAADWTLNAETGIYEYVYENVNIKDTSFVDIVPYTEDVSIVIAAGVFPETKSSKGQVILFAQYQPEADIRITVNITESTL